MFMFITQKIPFPMFKLKIFDQKILIKDLDHKLLDPWSILIPLTPLLPGKAKFISQMVA